MDYTCLQNQVVTACRDQESTVDSCLGLVERLATHEHSDSISWQLALATTYSVLSDLASLAQPDEGALSSEQTLMYRREARMLLEGVLGQEPNNVEALIGLSVLSEEDSSKISYLKRAAVADPANTFASQGLVRRLLASGSDEEVIEAAQTLLRSYRSTPSGTTKWRLADNIVDIYKSFSKAVELEDFTVELSSDIDFNEFIIDGNDAVTRINTLPLTYCNSSIIDILGSEHCLSSIDILVDLAAKSSSAELRQTLVNIGAKAIILAGQSDQLRGSNPDWINVLLKYVEELNTLNVPVATLYEAKANLVTGEDQISALEDAILSAPDNGQYYYRLAMIFLERENWAEAAELFRRAKELLPEWRHDVLDQYLNEALEHSLP